MQQKLAQKKRFFKPAFAKRAAMVGLAALTALAPLKARAQSNYLKFALIEHSGAMPAMEINREIEIAKTKGKPFQFVLIESAGLLKKERLVEEKWYNGQVDAGRKMYLDLVKTNGTNYANLMLKQAANKIIGEEFGAELFCGVVKGNLLVKYAEQNKNVKEYESQDKILRDAQKITGSIRWNDSSSNILQTVRAGLTAEQKYFDSRDAPIANTIREAIKELRKEHPEFKSKNLNGLVVLGSMHGSVMAKVNGTQKIETSRLVIPIITRELHSEIMKEMVAQNKRVNSEEGINRFFTAVIFMPKYEEILKTGKAQEAYFLKKLLVNLPQERIAQAIKQTQNLVGQERAREMARMLGFLGK